MAQTSCLLWSVGLDYCERSFISRLEKRGLVERSPHPDDARGVLINITDAGREAIHQTFPLIERKVINRFAAHFSAEELLTIAGLLERH